MKSVWILTLVIAVTCGQRPEVLTAARLEKFI